MGKRVSSVLTCWLVVRAFSAAAGPMIVVEFEGFW